MLNYKKYNNISNTYKNYIWGNHWGPWSPCTREPTRCIAEIVHVLKYVCDRSSHFTIFYSTRGYNISGGRVAMAYQAKNIYKIYTHIYTRMYNKLYKHIYKTYTQIYTKTSTKYIQQYIQKYIQQYRKNIYTMYNKYMQKK